MEKSSDSLIEEKYGYVEKVKEDWQYKNIDYRDTTAPLWQELNKIHTDPEYFPSKGEKIDYNPDIIIAKLLPLKRETDIPETLNFVATPSLGYGYMHTRWSPTSNIEYWFEV